MRYNKHNGTGLTKELRFSLLNFSFILKLYANPVEADINVDKVISPKEAWEPAAAYLANMIAIFAGCRLGRFLVKKLPFNISWLSGITLIVLAVLRLF